MEIDGSRPLGVNRTPRRQLGAALPHRSRARVGGAERSALPRTLRAPASQDHHQTITRAYNLPRPRAGDKKTTYDRRNTTSVVNITTYENRSFIENARFRRGKSTRLPTLTAYQYLRGRRATLRERFRTSKDDDSAQVTVYETIIELENITSKQNISVLVNETVLFNTTINVTYDVLRNVTYDVTFNQTYNVTFNTTVNATDSA